MPEVGEENEHDVREDVVHPESESKLDKEKKSKKDKKEKKQVSSSKEALDDSEKAETKDNTDLDSDLLAAKKAKKEKKHKAERSDNNEQSEPDPESIRMGTEEGVGIDQEESDRKHDKKSKKKEKADKHHKLDDAAFDGENKTARETGQEPENERTHEDANHEHLNEPSTSKADKKDKKEKKEKKRQQEEPNGDDVLDSGKKEEHASGVDDGREADVTGSADKKQKKQKKEKVRDAEGNEASEGHESGESPKKEKKHKKEKRHSKENGDVDGTIDGKNEEKDASQIHEASEHEAETVQDADKKLKKDKKEKKEKKKQQEEPNGDDVLDSEKKQEHASGVDNGHEADVVGSADKKQKKQKKEKVQDSEGNEVSEGHESGGSPKKEKKHKKEKHHSKDNGDVDGTNDGKNEEKDEHGDAGQDVDKKTKKDQKEKKAHSSRNRSEEDHDMSSEVEADKHHKKSKKDKKHKADKESGDDPVTGHTTSADVQKSSHERNSNHAIEETSASEHQSQVHESGASERHKELGAAILRLTEQDAKLATAEASLQESLAAAAGEGGSTAPGAAAQAAALAKVSKKRAKVKMQLRSEEEQLAEQPPELHSEERQSTRLRSTSGFVAALVSEFDLLRLQVERLRAEEEKLRVAVTELNSQILVASDVAKKQAFFKTLAKVSNKHAKTVAQLRASEEELALDAHLESELAQMEQAMHAEQEAKDEAHACMIKFQAEIVVTMAQQNRHDALASELQQTTAAAAPLLQRQNEIEHLAAATAALEKTAEADADHAAAFRRMRSSHASLISRVNRQYPELEALVDRARELESELALSEEALSQCTESKAEAHAAVVAAEGAAEAATLAGPWRQHSSQHGHHDDHHHSHSIAEATSAEIEVSQYDMEQEEAERRALERQERELERISREKATDMKRLDELDTELRISTEEAEALEKTRDQLQRLSETEASLKSEIEEGGPGTAARANVLDKILAKRAKLGVRTQKCEEALVRADDLSLRLEAEHAAYTFDKYRDEMESETRRAALMELAWERKRREEEALAKSEHELSERSQSSQQRRALGHASNTSQTYLAEMMGVANTRVRVVAEMDDCLHERSAAEQAARHLEEEFAAATEMQSTSSWSAIAAASSMQRSEKGAERMRIELAEASAAEMKLHAVADTLPSDTPEELAALRILADSYGRVNVRLRDEEEQLAAAKAELAVAASSQRKAQDEEPSAKEIMHEATIERKARAVDAVKRFRDEDGRLAYAENLLVEEAGGLSDATASPATMAVLARIIRSRSNVEGQIQHEEAEIATLSEEVDAERAAESAKQAAIAVKIANKRANAFLKRERQLVEEKKRHLNQLDEHQRRAYDRLEESGNLQSKIVRERMRQGELTLMARAAIEREYLLQKHRRAQRGHMESLRASAALVDDPARERRLDRTWSAIQRLQNLDRTRPLVLCVRAARAAASADRERLVKTLDYAVEQEFMTEDAASIERDTHLRELRQELESALRVTADTHAELDAGWKAVLGVTTTSEEPSSGSRQVSTMESRERKETLAAQYLDFISCDGQNYTTALVQTAAGPSWARWRAPTQTDEARPDEIEMTLIENEFWNEAARLDATGHAGSADFAGSSAIDVGAREPFRTNARRLERAGTASDMIAKLVTKRLQEQGTTQMRI